MLGEETFLASVVETTSLYLKYSITMQTLRSITYRKMAAEKVSSQFSMYEKKEPKRRPWMYKYTKH